MSGKLWDIMPCNTLKVNQKLVASMFMTEEHSMQETNTEQAASSVIVISHNTECFITAPVIVSDPAAL
jgi:hypothetical protein